MLERWLASQLATYLVVGPQDTRVSLTGREIVVSRASLKTEPLNALLEASPLQVAAGQLSSLKIKCRPLTTSAIHIELSDLQLSLEPRYAIIYAGIGNVVGEIVPRRWKCSWDARKKFRIQFSALMQSDAVY